MDKHRISELEEEAKAGARVFVKYRDEWIKVYIPSLLTAFHKTKAVEFYARTEIRDGGSVDYFLLQ